MFLSMKPRMFYSSGKSELLNAAATHVNPFSPLAPMPSSSHAAAEESVAQVYVARMMAILTATANGRAEASGDLHGC